MLTTHNRMVHSRFINFFFFCILSPGSSSNSRAGFQLPKPGIMCAMQYEEGQVANQTDINTNWQQVANL